MRFVEDSNWAGADYLAILKRACRKDREALDWIFRQETSWLLSTIRSFFQSSPDATSEDLLQDCWLALMESTGNLDFPSRGAFRAWMRLVARNHWIRRQRRQREFQELPDALEAWKAPEGVPSPSLRSARKQLSFRQAAVLFLRDDWGCSYEVISRILDCKTATSARSLRSRALLGLSGREA